MPTKDLHHRLTADASGFQRGFSRAEQSARALERELARQEARQARVDAAMQQTGRVMLGIGAAIAAGLALSTRAAIQWESAWAGVAKTLNDATAPQLAALEDDLRDLARELPQSHQEIAAVAAAAGQLGVAAPDIAEFTRTMVDLGVATNLSSEEAAFAIARMANIMGTSQDDVRRLASTIVDLGNNSATTEAEITEMALRIAGAGQTIGLSESQVLGFAAALSSVGVRAQAGGTAITKVFLEIDTAVSQGGETLDTFASTAGMSAEEFARAYEQDAGAAVATFIAGLGRVQTSGGDVNAVLETLGLTEIRVSDALRRLAGSGDLLNASLRIGNEAWDENVALTEEAERRYGTVEARLQIARNQLNDFGVSIGQTILPVLGEFVDKASALVGVVNDLPAPVKTAITIVGGLAAALALTGGAAAITAVQVAKVKGALDLLENSTGRTAGAVRGLRRGLGAVPWGPVGIAVAGLTAVVGVFAMQQAEARQRVEELSDTLDQQTGAVTDNTRALIAHRLEQSGALETAQRYGIELSTLVDMVLGNAEAERIVTDAVRQHADVTEIQGQGITRVSGDIVTMRDQVLGLAGDLDQSQEATRRQAEATGEAADAASRLSPEAEHLADALGLSAGEAGTLNDELKEMDQRLQTLFDNAFGMAQAQDAVTESTRKLVDQIRDQVTEGDKGAASLTGQSEAAIANRRAIEDLVEKQGEHLQAIFEETGSLQAVQDQTDAYRDELIALAEQLGLDRDEVDRYIDVLEMIPDTVNTSVNLDTAAAAAALRRFNQQLSQTPGFGGFEVRHAGGEIGTRFPLASNEVPVIAQRGEFMSTVDATRRNRAALEAANAGARLAVVGAGSGSTGGGAVPVTGGMFTGTLRLSTGEFLGVVDGRIEQREMQLVDRITAGVGAAR